MRYIQLDWEDWLLYKTSFSAVSIREITFHLPDHSGAAVERRFRHCTIIPDGYVRSITLRMNENFGGIKRYSRALTLVTTRFHELTGPVLFCPIPKKPLWNPPGRGEQGSSKDDCVTEWVLYRFSSMVINTRSSGWGRCLQSKEFKSDRVIFSKRNGWWGVKASLHPNLHLVRKR